MNPYPYAASGYPAYGVPPAYPYYQQPQQAYAHAGTAYPAAAAVYGGYPYSTYAYPPHASATPVASATPSSATPAPSVLAAAAAFPADEPEAQLAEDEYADEEEYDADGTIKPKRRLDKIPTYVAPVMCVLVVVCAVIGSAGG